MRRVLIFGARGQLGHDLTDLLGTKYEIAGVGSEIDITSAKAVEECIQSVRPNIVINSAAYNKVEEADVNVALAYAVNAFGPLYIARECQKMDIPILHVSTDYVFDGETQNGFSEDHPVCPINIYGASKEAGERLVRMANAKHWIVRTSALFGSHAGHGKGYNFVTRMLALAGEKGKVRVVGDQWTSPTYTRDLAGGIDTLLLREVPFGTYHLSGEGETTWAGFAEAIFTNAGITPTLSMVTTKESGTKIARPKKSILRNLKLKGLGITLPPWDDGLKRYLAEIGTRGT